MIGAKLEQRDEPPLPRFRFTSRVLWVSGVSEKIPASLAESNAKGAREETHDRRQVPSP